VGSGLVASSPQELDRGNDGLPWTVEMIDDAADAFTACNDRLVRGSPWAANAPGSAGIADRLGSVWALLAIVTLLLARWRGGS